MQLLKKPEKKKKKKKPGLQLDFNPWPRDSGEITLIKYDLYRNHVDKHLPNLVNAGWLLRISSWEKGKGHNQKHNIYIYIYIYIYNEEIQIKARYYGFEPCSLVVKIRMSVLRALLIVMLLTLPKKKNLKL